MYTVLQSLIILLHYYFNIWDSCSDKRGNYNYYRHVNISLFKSMEIEHTT